MPKYWNVARLLDTLTHAFLVIERITDMNIVIIITKKLLLLKHFAVRHFFTFYIIQSYCNQFILVIQPYSRNWCQIFELMECTYNVCRRAKVMMQHDVNIHCSTLYLYLNALKRVIYFQSICLAIIVAANKAWNVRMSIMRVEHDYRCIDLSHTVVSPPSRIKVPLHIRYLLSAGDF